MNALSGRLALSRARQPKRPRAAHVIAGLFDDFHELHGDRQGSDDSAMVTGLGTLHGRWTAVAALERGTTPAEHAERSFGMPRPGGYRKAQRIMALAERFGLPLLCIVDTPGAHCGAESEASGQAWAIADTLATAMTLRTPIVSVVLSEASSGGALALSVADHVAALENALYTVAPPETFAVILYGDVAERDRAAAAVDITVRAAQRAGLVDALIAEPPDGAHTDPAATVDAIGAHLRGVLGTLVRVPVDHLVARRLRRYRWVGDPLPVAP